MNTLWSDPFEFLARTHLLEPYLLDDEHSPRYRITLAAIILFGKEAALNRFLPFFETLVSVLGQQRTLRRTLSGKLPQPTIRELLVNAYIHRCWRTPAPVVVDLSSSGFEIHNPGDLLPGLNVNSLLHCVPAYRNSLLAEAARFFGLCDKIGKGIDIVFESALSGGFDLPTFESADNHFVARVGLERSEEFREFLSRRSSSLSSIDQILTLRLLWSKPEAVLDEISLVLQRSRDVTKKILGEMKKQLMIESVSESSGEMFRLSSGIRFDIGNVFHADQMQFDLYQG